MEETSRRRRRQRWVHTNSYSVRTISLATASHTNGTFAKNGAGRRGSTSSTRNTPAAPAAPACAPRLGQQNKPLSFTHNNSEQNAGMGTALNFNTARSDRTRRYFNMGKQHAFDDVVNLCLCQTMQHADWIACCLRYHRQMQSCSGLPSTINPHTGRYRIGPPFRHLTIVYQ